VKQQAATGYVRVHRALTGGPVFLRPPPKSFEAPRTGAKPPAQARTRSWTKAHRGPPAGYLTESAGDVPASRRSWTATTPRCTSPDPRGTFRQAMRRVAGRPRRRVPAVHDARLSGPASVRSQVDPVLSALATPIEEHSRPERTVNRFRGRGSRRRSSTGPDDQASHPDLAWHGVFRLAQECRLGLAVNPVATAPAPEAGAERKLEAEYLLTRPRLWPLARHARERRPTRGRCSRSRAGRDSRWGELAAPALRGRALRAGGCTSGSTANRAGWRRRRTAEVRLRTCPGTELWDQGGGPSWPSSRTARRTFGHGRND
jgi:hypothetical protein